LQVLVYISVFGGIGYERERSQVPPAKPAA